MPEQKENQRLASSFTPSQLALPLFILASDSLFGSTFIWVVIPIVGLLRGFKSWCYWERLILWGPQPAGKLQSWQTLMPPAQFKVNGPESWGLVSTQTTMSPTPDLSFLPLAWHVVKWTTLATVHQAGNRRSDDACPRNLPLSLYGPCFMLRALSDPQVWISSDKAVGSLMVPSYWEHPSAFPVSCLSTSESRTLGAPASATCPWKTLGK